MGVLGLGETRPFFSKMGEFIHNRLHDDEEFDALFSDSPEDVNPSTIAIVTCPERMFAEVKDMANEFDLYLEDSDAAMVSTSEGLKKFLLTGPNVFLVLEVPKSKSKHLN